MFLCCTAMKLEVGICMCLSVCLPESLSSRPLGYYSKICIKGLGDLSITSSLDMQLCLNSPLQ